MIDIIFLERDHYGYVYNSDGTPVNNSIDDLYWIESTIIYAESSFSPEFIKEWLAYNSSLTTLVDMNTSSNGYHIFMATK